MTRTSSLRIAIGALCLAAVSGPAVAASTQQTTFKVTADVTASCTIAAADLDFAAYDPGGSAVPGQSQITVHCTNGTTWNVGLNAGVFSGATTSTRKMTGPGSFALAYGLFTDASHSTNWGNVVGTDTQAGTGTGVDQILNVYGLIPASQNVGAGHYEDTITATVTF
ncbi:MAG TPA: spore coat U domain-containing protein [Sphingomicrobium sp.]|jgi:spore coat protein U-like protein|nr:spore coat U domain-containing protein [Sphingomicrobium sp.]